MRFLLNAKKYKINCVVTCGSEPYIMSSIFYGKSIIDAKLQFSTTKGHFAKIVNIAEM